MRHLVIPQGCPCVLMCQSEAIIIVSGGSGPESNIRIWHPVLSPVLSGLSEVNQ